MQIINTPHRPVPSALCTYTDIVVHVSIFHEWEAALLLSILNTFWGKDRKYNRIITIRERTEANLNYRKSLQRLNPSLHIRQATVMLNT